MVRISKGIIVGVAKTFITVDIDNLSTILRTTSYDLWRGRQGSSYDLFIVRYDNAYLSSDYVFDNEMDAQLFENMLSILFNKPLTLSNMVSTHGYKYIMKLILNEDIRSFSNLSTLNYKENGELLEGLLKIYKK